MKVSLPKDNFASSSKAELLPLELDTLESETLDSSNSVRYELKTSPAEADSPTYRKTIRILQGSESIRTIIQWVKDVDTVMIGLGLDVDPAGATLRVPIARSMMTGTPRTIFNQNLDMAMTAARQAAALTAFNAGQAANPQTGIADRDAILAQDITAHLVNNPIVLALQCVVGGLVPAKALQRIKRSLRRKMRKPVGMNVRTYIQHLLRINREELPFLPPYLPNNSLSDDELIDIFLFGTPRSWQVEMERQGFDPLTKHINEVTAFMEQIESAESFTLQVGADAKNGSSNTKHSGKSTKKKGSSSNSGGGKHCEIHGKCGHSTNECRTIQQIKEDGGGKPASKNKSWKSKDWKAKTKPDKELSAFVKQAVKREMNALSDDKKDKKRSRKEEAHNFESDDEISLSKMDFNSFVKDVEDDSDNSIVSV